MARPDAGRGPGRPRAPESDPELSAARRAELERLSRLAHVLDDLVKLPGTDFRVGLDGVAGLIPGVGDAVSAAVSAYLIARAAKLGLPVTLILRMVGNLGLDLVVGAIPVVGDLFDFGFRANRRNVELLRRHLERAAT
jgi:hypothetical protein